MSFKRIACVAAIFMMTSFTALAGNQRCDDPKEKDATELVEQGIKFVATNGKQALIDAINKKDPAFVCGELYLVLRQSSDGVMLAHPHNPKLIGKAMLDVPDVDGKMFRQDMMDTANKHGSGWVDYKWKNPTSQQVEHKSMFVKKAGDMVYGAGIYK